jgi:predicted HD phosphohydrolase
LNFRHSDYHSTLSEASKLTLIAQGGPMTADEAIEFEARNDFEALIRMRHWDDLVKDTTVEAESENTERYRKMCEKVLETKKAAQKKQSKHKD